jgi:alpha-beta hydrolase superfamily lysophospholipase
MGRRWSHQGLAADLRAAGHRAVVVELRGLGERRGELHPGITLSDHIDDVCAAVEQAGLTASCWSAIPMAAW